MLVNLSLKILINNKNGKKWNVLKYKKKNHNDEEIRLLTKVIYFRTNFINSVIIPIKKLPD